MRTVNRGEAHEAAVIETICKTGLDRVSVTRMAEQLYLALGIEEDDSYGRLLQGLNGEAIDKIGAFCVNNNEPFTDFVICFLNLETLISNYGREKSVPQKTKSDSMSALQQFKNLIVGQDDAKKQILDAVLCMKMNSERVRYGLKDNGMHNVFVFSGPPGTAKTTAAQLLGRIMCEEDLLKSEKRITLSGASLKGAYVGQTAPHVHEVFSDNDIIFIDEIYSLVDSYGIQDSFAQEALGQLCIELEENCIGKLIVMAGYGGQVNSEDNKIKDFLDKNPGISSRINYIVEFKPYDPYTDMPAILINQAENLGYQIEAGAIGQATEFFATRAASRDYGNGREARRLLEHSLKQQSIRLYNMVNYTPEDMKLLTEEDIILAADEIMAGCKIVAGKSEREIGF